MASPDGMWHKSSFSDQGNGCVEVRISACHVSIRDTKLAPNSPEIHFSHDEWESWITALAGPAVGLPPAVSNADFPWP